MKLYWPVAEYQKDGREDKIWTYNACTSMAEAQNVFASWAETYDLTRTFVEVYEGERKKIVEVELPNPSV